MRGPERVPVPAHVARQPGAQLEVRDAERPVEPDGRHLGHRQAGPARLGHELETDLEALVALDTDFSHERRRVRLERVRGVARADAGEVVQAQPGQAREQALQRRAAHLLPTARETASGGDHHTPLDQAGQLVDLHRVVAAVGHRHHRHRCGRVVEAIVDGVGRAATVGVQRRSDSRIARRVRVEERHGRVVPAVEHDEHFARQVDGFEDAVETTDDVFALLVHRDHHRHARRARFGRARHTRTPPPRTFHTSITGVSVTISR